MSDPVTKREYVLLEAGTYERLQSLLECADPRELCPLLHRAMQDEAWDDPQMPDTDQVFGVREVFEASISRPTYVYLLAMRADGQGNCAGQKIPIKIVDGRETEGSLND